MKLRPNAAARQTGSQVGGLSSSCSCSLKTFLEVNLHLIMKIQKLMFHGSFGSYSQDFVCDVFYWDSIILKVYV